MAIVAMVVGWIQFAASRAPGHDATAPSRVELTDELTGRLILSVKAIERSSGGSVSADALLVQADSMAAGSPAQQLAYVVLLSEMRGVDVGLQEAAKRGEAAGQIWNDDDIALRAAIVERLEQRRDQLNIAPLDADARERLGWYAELVEGTAKPSAAAVIALSGAGVWYLVFGLGGFILLVLFLSLSGLGRMRAACTPPTTFGPVLVETFAIWMCLFFGANLGLGLIADSIESDWLRLLIAPTVFFGSLIALAWPSIRGVQWKDTRAAIGWTTNGVANDIGWGFIGYALALPLLGLGLVVMFALSSLLGQAPNASHPAIERIAHAGPVGLAVIFLLACIAAPIVEETMFRGVLYRHLRDATTPSGGSVSAGFRTAGTVLSVTISALVSSTIFAAIHPQGLLFIPVLAGLACGFCLVREWRGSLLPGMVAHGIQNFVTIGLNVAIQAWIVSP
ncbi:MAG: CPBP family intramembrane glutamic endopeptidase [Phycisphaerae bacterium]|nr:CPBP family intramembrane glutamic endopeptidase [Phycisphaerae bacterium]